MRFFAYPLLACSLFVFSVRGDLCPVINESQYECTGSTFSTACVAVKAAGRLCSTCRLTPPAECCVCMPPKTPPLLSSQRDVLPLSVEPPKASPLPLPQRGILPLSVEPQHPCTQQCFHIYPGDTACRGIGYQLPAVDTQCGIWLEVPGFEPAGGYYMAGLSVIHDSQMCSVNASLYASRGDKAKAECSAATHTADINEIGKDCVALKGDGSVQMGECN